MFDCLFHFQNDISIALSANFGIIAALDNGFNGLNGFFIQS